MVRNITGIQAFLSLAIILTTMWFHSWDLFLIFILGIVIGLTHK